MNAARVNIFMPDPFVIREDSISGTRLEDTPSKRWVENIAPQDDRGIDYLKPAFKRWRLQGLLIFFVAVGVMFFARTAQLQIFEKGIHTAAAETNRLRFLRVRAPRGIIIDRAGKALTRNIPSFQLTVNPLDLPRERQQREYALARIAEMTRMPIDEVRRLVAIVRLPVSPIVIASNLTLDDVYPILMAAQGIPGIVLEPIAVREYLKGPAFAHILGYLGKIDEDEKEYYRGHAYDLNAAIGKAGLEAAFEADLHGVDGRIYEEVDATGKIQRIVAQDEATPGKTLRLAIDADLQEYAYRTAYGALKRTGSPAGAVVALSPRDGAILAMVSLPSYDNNVFTLRLHAPKDEDSPSDGDPVFELLNDESKPLFFRPISGSYPSGSTIKPALAAAGLARGIIDAHTTFLSTGGIRVGQWFFPDWRAGGHGPTDVRRALAESVNTFFYILGGGFGTYRGLGIDEMGDAFREFGFSKKTGIEIPGEAVGLIPSPQWKQDKRGEPWYIGDTYHLAIGQGDILVTPLQIARMTAYFASEGQWTQPRVVMTAGPPEGRTAADDTGPQLNPAHIQIVREGLRDAVRYGSARSLQALSITSAGKTGTAQWASIKKPHAWFTGWAPYDNPEIVVTVLIEEGGEGSAVAVPIAREIMEWWFENRMKNQGLDE